jgi:hypothetical protein
VRDGEALDGLAAFEIEITDPLELIRRLFDACADIGAKAARGETEDCRQ